MKILITAPSCAGKSTIIFKVKQFFVDDIRGVWSRENTIDGHRTGFSSILGDGTEKEFMSKHESTESKLADADSIYTIGSYRVNLSVIDEFVAPELERCLDDTNNIIYIDEIGRAQAFSERFLGAVRNLFDSDKVILATIVLEDEPWSRHFKQHSDTWLITVTPDNRDSLPYIINAMCRNAPLLNNLETDHRQHLKILFFTLLNTGQFISARKLFENTLRYVTEARVERLNSQGNISDSN